MTPTERLWQRLQAASIELAKARCDATSPFDIPRAAEMIRLDALVHAYATLYAAADERLEAHVEVARHFPRPTTAEERKGGL